MKRLKLQGIIPATVLPMTVDAKMDEGALKAYLAWLLDQGIHGLAINVDTGEGPHLHSAERIKVVEIVTKETRGRVPVISGLGAAFTEQAIQAAKDLKSAGADTLLVFPPSAFRGSPLPPELVVDFFQRVGEGADIGLILFQLQEGLGGVEFPLDVMVQVAKLPHVIAMKEATFDALKFKNTVAAMRQEKVDMTILTGNDNFIYESFLLGAEGALIGFGTLVPKMQVDMYNAHVQGRHQLAKALGQKIQALADVIFAPPVRDYRVRTKEALRMMRVIPRATVRLPLHPASEAARKKIESALREIGEL